MEKNKIIGIVGLVGVAGVGVYLWRKRKTEKAGETEEKLKKEPKKMIVEKTKPSKIPQEFVEGINAMKSSDKTYPKPSQAWIHRDPYTREVKAITVDRAIADVSKPSELGYMTVTKTGNVIYSSQYRGRTDKIPHLLTDEERKCQTKALAKYNEFGGWKAGYTIREGGRAVYDKDGNVVFKC